MREILFRGKAFENGNWYYGDINHGSDEPHNPCTISDYKNRARIAVIPETVGQFTGLCDKNGVKIFEGDIVSIDVHGEYDNYVVSYDRENARFVFGVTDLIFWADIPGRAEVIGNIYDDPELIGGDSNA